ncbi:MAG: sialate O-acetylesterase [Bacteroidales bacterium]
MQKSNAANPVTKIHPVKVFILAGQSNAVGYNNIKELRGYHSFQTENSANFSKILFWPGSNAKPGYANTWTKLQPGVSEISLNEPYKEGSFGPEMGFALAIQKLLPDEKIAIIKYAEGGTGIARSQDYSDYVPALKDFNDKGRNWYPTVNGKEGGLLYKNLTDNIQNGLTALKNQGLNYEISGFLWMQGEHEAGISKKMAGDYGKLMTLFRDAVRSDLNINDLPFVVGEINSHTWAFADIARKEQAEACQKDLNTILVKTIDLTRGSIGGAAHFDANGMMTLGERFAQGMITLINKK